MPTGQQQSRFAYLVDLLGADVVAERIHAPRPSFAALLDTFTALGPTDAQATLRTLAAMVS